MKKENGLTHMTTIFLVIIILVLILVAVRFVELQYKNEESETIKELYEEANKNNKEDK